MRLESSSLLCRFVGEQSVPCLTTHLPAVIRSIGIHGLTSSPELYNRSVVVQNNVMSSLFPLISFDRFVDGTFDTTEE